MKVGYGKFSALLRQPRLPRHTSGSRRRPRARPTPTAATTSERVAPCLLPGSRPLRGRPPSLGILCAEEGPPQGSYTQIPISAYRGSAYLTPNTKKCIPYTTHGRYTPTRSILHAGVRVFARTPHLTLNISLSLSLSLSLSIYIYIHTYTVYIIWYSITTTLQHHIIASYNTTYYSSAPQLRRPPRPSMSRKFIVYIIITPCLHIISYILLLSPPPRPPPAAAVANWSWLLLVLLLWLLWWLSLLLLLWLLLYYY